MRNMQVAFCVSVKLLRHSDTLIWVPFSRTLMMLEVQLWGQFGQGSHDLDIGQKVTQGLSKAYVHRDRKGSNPVIILF